MGGVNFNVLLEPNYKLANEDSLKIAEDIPRLINICGRTEEAFNQMCDWIQKNPQKVSRDFLALLSDTMKMSPALNSSGMPFRGIPSPFKLMSILIIFYSNSGSLLINKLGDNSYAYKRHYSLFERKIRRPLWYIFPGLGGEWVSMAKALMPIKVFSDTIEECHQILLYFNIDLKNILLSDDKKSISTMNNKFCAKTALQIGLVNILNSLDITPNGIIGHSFGEIAAAYADGCITAKEAIFTAAVRGHSTEGNSKIPRGAMAIIGLSWEEAKSICPEGVQVVCNNDADNVVISGMLFNDCNFEIIFK